jgi:hypothetical protein
LSGLPEEPNEIEELVTQTGSIVVEVEEDKLIK